MHLRGGKFHYGQALAEKDQATVGRALDEGCLWPCCGPPARTPAKSLPGSVST